MSSMKIAHFVQIGQQTWPPHAILVPDWLISKKSSPLKLLSHMNRNLVGSIYMYGRFCIKFPQSRMKGERHRLSPLSLCQGLELGLWCLTQFSGVSFIGGRNREYTEKTTDLSQVTDKLYHIINVVSSTHRHEIDSNSQLQWSQLLIAQVVVNPTTIRSRPRPLLFIYEWMPCFNILTINQKQNPVFCYL